MDEEQLNEEIQLWKRCIDNEKGAWETFFERYHRLIWWVINRELPGAGFDKDDIFQEASEKIIKSISQWKKKASLATYIRVISRNATIDYIRKHGRNIELGEDSAISRDEMKEKKDDKADPELLYNKIDIAKILKSLSRQDALLIRMRYFDGDSSEDIAAFFHISVNALHTRESRALSKLKKQLKKEGY
jgi:RNA polymerase sigma factor (sigma-70 family)